MLFPIRPGPYYSYFDAVVGLVGFTVVGFTGDASLTDRTDLEIYRLLPCF